MSTHGDYFGEVTLALTHLTADRLEPARDRLLPQMPTPQDLPEPRPSARRALPEQSRSSTWDPSMPLFVVLDGPGVIGL